MRKSQAMKVVSVLFFAMMVDTGSVAVADGGDDGGGGGGGEIRRECPLQLTGVRPNASGRGRTRDEGSSRQEIDFEIRGLNANANYIFVADDVTLGTRKSDANGFMEPEFQNAQIPSSLKPVSNVKRLEVYTGARVLALFCNL